MSTTHQPSLGTDTGDALGRVLAQVRSELSDLVDVPVWGLDDRRLDTRLADALAAKAACDEIVARLAGEADDRGLAQRAGASSTRAHLVASHRLSRSEASRVVRAARELHGPSAVTEPVRRAQACGAVSQEHAVTIAAAINRLDRGTPIDKVEALQHDLIGHAQTLSFDQLCIVANHAVEVVDPDAADRVLEQQLHRQEQLALAGCELTISVHPDGTSNGRFTRLPATTTAMLRKALDAIGSPRRCATLEAEADRPGTHPETQREDLPFANRMGRAFCELIEHLPVDGLPQHGVANATVVVTIDEARLRRGCGEATLDTGAVVSTSETRRLACNAGLLPMVLSGDSKVLDLGRTQRLFSRHQRLALARRDGGCVFPGCDRPPAWCEAHHMGAWSEGGATDLDNGVLLCGFHHHLIHRGEWSLVMAADGIPEAIPPARIDQARRPIRHQRFKPRAA